MALGNEIDHRGRHRVGIVVVHGAVEKDGLLPVQLIPARGKQPAASPVEGAENPQPAEHGRPDRRAQVGRAQRVEHLLGHGYRARVEDDSGIA